MRRGQRGASARRELTLTRLLAGTLVAFGLACAQCASARPPASAGVGRHAAQASASAQRAYEFLYAMMDRYAGGSSLRLVQSFAGGVLEKRGYTDSVSYDDALIVDALLARGSGEDVARARVLGDALLYVQENDPRHDGRVRAAYEPDVLASPADVHATDANSDVGNMAWVGMALTQLYVSTGAGAYLAGARALGEWIYASAYDTRGSGGYTGGQDASGARIRWKSTEHNIDVYALFGMLAAQTGESAWSRRAAWARGFIASMWSASKHTFYVGTTSDGVTPNRAVHPEDVDSWSYLALREGAYSSSLDWEIRHLHVSRGGFAGVSFCTGDRSGVWFEGAAHLADALALRAASGDAERAQEYLGDIAHAQEAGPNSDGRGIIAASKNGLRDCEGEAYFASLHTGATAWDLLALGAVDPFMAFA